MMAKRSGDFVLVIPYDSQNNSQALKWVNLSAVEDIDVYSGSHQSWKSIIRKIGATATIGVSETVGEILSFEDPV